MSTLLETMETKAAYQVGFGRARVWHTPDTKASKVHTLAAWRAICYADAVMFYEPDPAFMDLLTQWELGFDSVAQAADNPPAEAMSAQATGAVSPPGPCNVGQYVECQDIDRAPYELGALLRRLPPEFLSASSVTQGDLAIAEMARRHAENANSELMAGLEALGKIMLLAGENIDVGADKSTLSSLGALLRHIAAEARFFQETANSLAFGCELRARQLQQKSGGDHA